MLEVVYKHMELKEFAREVLNLRMERQEEAEGSLPTRPTEEFSTLNTIFLAVKYNPEALKKMLDLAQTHDLLGQVIQEGKNGFNILQFAAMNKTPACLEYRHRFHKYIFSLHFYQNDAGGL